MALADPVPVSEEERLVAELERLSIRYLSRQTSYQAGEVRPPARLLADLIRQPGARVRASVIAVLLARPEFAEAVPAALEGLRADEQLTLKLFYTAAALLQQAYAEQLRRFVGQRWRWLPDLFSAELKVPSEGTPRDRLLSLGRAHGRLTNTAVNWPGTYENVAQRLLRRWEMERIWSR